MMVLKQCFAVAVLGAVLSFVAVAQTSPDTGLDAYARLLTQAVIPNAAGTASEVDYAWLAEHRGELQSVLKAFSAVPTADFDGWSGDARLAFLINAYNAFTLELIVTQYPDLKSIRDLGSIFRSPWKKKFVDLLGEKRSLDDIEHSMIRGQFEEPRIHAAVNCASCGCPALLNAPFRASQLEQQLATVMAGFLSDQTRNYFDEDSNTLYLSPLFDWYEDDFVESAGSVMEYVEPWFDVPGLSDSSRQTATPSPRLRFTDYDWQLNDLGRCAG